MKTIERRRGALSWWEIVSYVVVVALGLAVLLLAFNFIVQVEYLVFCGGGMKRDGEQRKNEHTDLQVKK